MQQIFVKCLEFPCWLKLPQHSFQTWYYMILDFRKHLFHGTNTSVSQSKLPMASFEPRICGIFIFCIQRNSRLCKRRGFPVLFLQCPSVEVPSNSVHAGLGSSLFIFVPLLSEVLCWGCALRMHGKGMSALYMYTCCKTSLISTSLSKAGSFVF